MTVCNKGIDRFGSENLDRAVNVILWLILLITAICVLVPFSPSMPAASLDPSWGLGMNEAVAQDLSFGKEMIFTFGPYAAIYTKTYHPATDFMMMSGSLYLAVFYTAYLLILMRDVRWRWVLSFCALLAGLMYSPDILLYSFPLLIGLLIFKIYFLSKGWQIKKLTPLYIALLFTPLGLLPLIKGSVLILVGLIVVLCAAIFIVNKHRLLAIICLLSPIISMLFFWTVSGQSLANLPAYFISMAPIISGYTEAMAANGPITEVILYLMASGFLLLTITLQKQMPNTSKIFLFAVYFVFLFLSFKAGFVRHDHGHALAAGTAILTAALLLPLIFNNWTILPAILVALFSGLYIDNQYAHTSIKSFSDKSKSTYQTAWHGIKNRIKNKNELRHKFDTAVSSLRKEAAFPILPGSTDIYSYDQSYLIASGNTWSPRPVFQSYSVYTPALAEINRKHLLGNQAPDNIIFKVEPIDGRLPSMEDGVSWPILLKNYSPTHIEKDFLFLVKKENTNTIDESLKLTTEKHIFGERVNLPYSELPIFAQIEIKPTILGRLMSILYKPSQLNMLLELNNGIKKQYRIISGMAKSGFVISPLIENTAEFGMLYGDVGFLNSKFVKSITIAPSVERSIFWNMDYIVTFSQVNTSAPIDLSQLFKFDKFDDKLSGSNITTAEKCDGFIDSVNGQSPISPKISVSSLLNINGWSAASVEKSILPEAVYIVLTDDKGKHNFVKAHKIVRGDVRAYFKKPELNDSGYEVMADISTLNGQYSLGLAIKLSDKIVMCPQFNIPITIAK